MSARLAKQQVSQRATKLELPEPHESFTNLAQCSPQDISLHRPMPRAAVGVGLFRTEDAELIVQSHGDQTDPTTDPLRSASVNSFLYSLEDSFTGCGSLSGLSSKGGRSTAVETPPNAPDAFGRSCEMAQCHAPRRTRTLVGAARSDKLATDGRLIAF